MFGGAVGYIGRGVIILTYDAKAFVSIAFFVALRAADGILSFFSISLGRLSSARSTAKSGL